MADHIPQGVPHEHDGHLRVTYNDIHVLIGNTAAKIRDEFSPDLMCAIGGGGFIPARILRSFLKQGAKGEKKRNIPIQAVGLSLYEEVGFLDDDSGLAQEEKLGKEVIRTQWLDLSTLGNRALVGRRILIVVRFPPHESSSSDEATDCLWLLQDEVDDSRTTLEYTVRELTKDIEEHLARLSPEQRAATPPTELAIFVVHNKLKPKAGEIPAHVKYFSARHPLQHQMSSIVYTGADIEDRWVDYPWEQQDILLHDAVAAKQKALGL
ncbi:hypothetical protein OIV83_000595 [Microbotryomycetes sp. JL201]|nr:hypothetical protein OIV83_000595 [Microbotryomycetes sp. JL201]